MRTYRSASTALALTVAAFGWAQDNPAPSTQLNAPLTNDAFRARVNTFYGPEGLINVPHAYVTQRGRISIGANIARDHSVTGNYGFLDGVSVGGAYYEREGLSEGKFLLNGKIHIVPANFNNFEIGVGMIDALDRLERSFYGVASAEIGVPAQLTDTFNGVRVHAGYGTGVFGDHIIGGAELLFARRLSFIGEYDGKDVNIAARYVRDEGFRMQTGIRNKGIFFTMSYAFDF